MRYLLFCLLLSLPLAAAPAACGGHGDRANMLVTTSWLADHLHDKNLVVLAIGKQEEYDAGHIPGSLFFDYMDSHTMQGENKLNLELPPMQALAQSFGKYGVSNDSRIVLYQTKGWGAPMTRVYLTLDSMGLGPHTSIMDGNTETWKSENHPVTKRCGQGHARQDRAVRAERSHRLPRSGARRRAQSRDGHHRCAPSGFLHR
jgi:thiosulfate/3-mercaptopyruvate sulfurtransferase